MDPRFYRKLSEPSRRIVSPGSVRVGGKRTIAVALGQAVVQSANFAAPTSSVDTARTGDIVDQSCPDEGGAKKIIIEAAAQSAKKTGKKTPSSSPPGAQKDATTEAADEAAEEAAQPTKAVDVDPYEAFANIFQDGGYTDADKATLISKAWDFEKIFKFHADFGSAEFLDAESAVSYRFKDFKNKYLKDPKYLAENLGAALEEADRLKDERRRCRAYQICNVYLYRAREEKVPSDVYARFQHFVDEMKRFKEIIAEFNQAIRGIPAAQINKEDPTIQRYLPYITRVRADPATLSMEEETALNLVSRSLLACEEARTKDPSFEDPATSEKFKQATIEALRWQAYLYCMKPGSLRNPKDRRAWVNAHFGVSSETSAAMREALSDTGVKLWKKLFKAQGPFSEQKKMAVEALFKSRTGVHPTREKNRTWKETEAEALAFFNEVSPKLAAGVKEISSNGNVVWASGEYPRFITKNGGSETGTVMIATEERNPHSLWRKLRVYTRAAITSTWNHTNLTSDARKIFVRHLENAIVEEALSRDMGSDLGGEVLRNLEKGKQLDGIFSPLMLAKFNDEFEDEFLKLCDKLGPVRRIRFGAKGPRLEAEDIDKLYDDMLKKYGPDFFDFGDKNKLPYLAHARTVTRVPDRKADRPAYVPGSLRLDRSNYQVILDVLADGAVRHALKLPGTKNKTPAERDAIVEAILQAPSSTDFDGYIQRLGGRPQDPAYWNEVIEDVFGSLAAPFLGDVPAEGFAPTPEPTTQEPVTTTPQPTMS